MTQLLESQPVERPTLGDLNSPQAKLVYLYIHGEGSATVSELCESLGVKKIALYPVLETLTRRDYVTSEGERYLPSTAN